MKVKKGFVLRKVGKDQVVVALGEASALLNGLIKLNGSGTFLWEQLAVGAEREELISALQQRYSVPSGQAEQDIDAFITTLNSVGCLE